MLSDVQPSIRATVLDAAARYCYAVLNMKENIVNLAEVNGMDEALGQVIRERRKAMRIHQQDVAEQVGLAPVVYGRIELGTRPCRAMELWRISRILGTTVDDLLESVRPVTVEELIERAETARVTAVNAVDNYVLAVQRASDAATHLL